MGCILVGETASFVSLPLLPVSYGVQVCVYPTSTCFRQLCAPSNSALDEMVLCLITIGLTDHYKHSPLPSP